METSRDVASLYERYATTHAGTKSIWDERTSFRRDIMPHVRPFGPPARILDVGCGQGRLVQQLHAHGYFNTHGIDLSAEQVALAVDSGIRNVELGDISDLACEQPGAWDVIVATDLVEHLTKPQVLELFGHVFDALSPNGQLVLRSPNAISPFSGIYQYGDFTHETFMTPKSFRQVAINAGFASHRVVPCKPYVHGMKSLVRYGAWSLIERALKGLVVIETGNPPEVVTQNFVGIAIKSA